MYENFGNNAGNDQKNLGEDSAKVDDIQQGIKNDVQQSANNDEQQNVIYNDVQQSANNDEQQNIIYNDVQQDTSDDIQQDTDRNLFQKNSVFLQTDDNKLGDSKLKRFTMDNKGRINAVNSGAAVMGRSRTFVVLGWICAALTFLLSPLFAIVGIIFGAMASREAKGRGNAIIITNIVLAVLGMLFGFISYMMQY